MAKKSDVDFSNQVEQPSDSSITQMEIATLAVQEARQPTDEYVIFKLVNTKRTGRVYIDGIDDVPNPNNKGRMERIWLLSGADSIWQSDLTELLKDKDYVRNNRRSLLFEAGILRVPTWDTPALDFIRHCRHFIDNPSRRTGSKFEFFEYNPKKQQEAALKKEMLELDMAIEAREMKEDKMRKIASYLGILFYDELGQPKTADGLRRELMLAAKRDPIRFQKCLDSKEVEVAYNVRKAIVDNKIDTTNGREAKWANGGTICSIPRDRKPLEYLTELALTNSQEGKDFLDQLQLISK
jgi:hypothetical protein